jgi:uncharacterized protein (TIGR02270 family)
MASPNLINCSLKGIEAGFYFEHLEEAAFLYQQRLSLLDDPEIIWKELAEFEERFEAHIDALVIGQDLALEVCRFQANEGDYGEMHAAVRIFCRKNKGNYLAETWRDIDPEDVEHIIAIRDALKYECPNEWQESLIPIFLRDYPRLIPVAAHVFGYRRYYAENALLHALERSPISTLPDLIWALGRIGGPNTPTAILPLLEHSHHTICKAAAECLLRLGKDDAIARVMQCAPYENWPMSALGLGGGPHAVKVLLDRFRHDNVEEDAVIALGVLGNVSAVSVLLYVLKNENLARSAATALYLITGAELHEDIYIPDEIDEDELFEEELEAYRSGGKVPTKSDGQPYGETVRRLSQNPEDWGIWLRENQSRFEPNYRYRLGKPYSPASLLETLLSETSPFRARQLAIEELKIRYNADFPIEADMPVVKQERILPRIAQWVQTNGTRFQPGAWYFAGRLIPG